MGMRRYIWSLMFLIFCQTLFSKEIVVGIEQLPQRHMALLFTPIVLPDLVSFKAAFEYRLHPKFNLVVPLEGKYMNYRSAIKYALKSAKQPYENFPEVLYEKDNLERPLWNINFSQFKLSSGIGAKWFPFSEAMTNAFFIKSSLMIGFEVFNAFQAEGEKNGAVVTHVVSIGYNWVKRNGFTLGIEAGEEYTWHINAIKGLPVFINGFMPILQFSLGFAI